jgi:hypothetical protein
MSEIELTDLHGDEVTLDLDKQSDGTFLLFITENKYTAAIHLTANKMKTLLTSLLEALENETNLQSE